LITNALRKKLVAVDVFFALDELKQPLVDLFITHLFTR
jgi:hypothetical protein